MHAAALLLLAALLCAPLSAQLAAPPLPRLLLESYPPSARQAIARASDAASARPDDAEAVGALGRVLHAWEQWEAASGAYARAEALAPRTPAWPYLHGLVLQRLARPAEAAAGFERAVALAPEDLPARLKLAETLLDAGDLDRSERLFTALTAPESAPAVAFGLGRIAAARGRHADAIVQFERAVGLFPEFGSAHYALARSYRAVGRQDEARAALEKHAQYGARWPALDDPVAATVSALREDAGALLQRGVKRADAGDLAGAIADHEAALAGDASFAQAHANLIGLYGRTRDWARAEVHYRAVVALAVNVADAHYDYGVLLGLQERWDEAAAAYREALALNPLHAEAHNNLGQILERTRQFDAAMAEYRLAVDAQPGLRVARFNLGRMLIGLGRPADAVRELQSLTVPRDAEAPRYLFALSTAYVRAGQKSEGMTWATAARDLALQFGDTALAAAIDRDLARIK